MSQSGALIPVEVSNQVQFVTVGRLPIDYHRGVPSATPTGMDSNRITSGFHGKWVFWTLLLLGLLAGGCDSSISPTSPNFDASPGEVEFQLFQLTNSARAAADVEPPLTSDPVLVEVAREHSAAMRDDGFFGHVGPDGRGLRQRLDDAGIGYSKAAENLAQVSNVGNPAEFTYDLLMDSERHRANILDPRYTLVGIGVVRSGDAYWITQIFVQP